ncbi:UDP-N-acetylmuramate dehydrogenase [Butyrivibrio sp. M55]|uniref:UDP-N-acetylmuramate dehydrogenase n=1 Tax=Butyrivibrio sp. M55 TaxID=1855323 RepID=UPI0008EEBA4C|nr:UDP-N-acetylmuramate dehydrogenase [Butyrivibrio sp. M55]SFU85013.1 UDP-N-acetylmuramate dehydrogenase [Butyrivibrio sp. M55]
MNNDFVNVLREIVSEENIILNENMSRHTTFRTGGPASLFISPKDTEQLLKVVEQLRKSDEEYFILGNGSNLLVSDEGYDGAVVSLKNFTDVSAESDTSIRAEAGALNSAIASFARDRELTGFEFAAGIPGTIGGAMVMNAGAYDGEMKQVVKEVKAISPEGELVTLSGDDMEFGYRTSFIKGKKYIVLSVLIELAEGQKEAIIEKMSDLAQRRRDKQPLEYPSAGSTFKRPEGNFAGKLIQDAGLRGYTVGGACVSEKHCGFVINKDSATSADIYRVIDDVRKKVYESYGVMLEPEVIMLGKFERIKP